MEIRITADAATAAAEAADWVAKQLRSAVLRRGSATLAISGGTTPAQMIGMIAGLFTGWSHVTVWQVDERVAPDGSAERNSALLDVLRSEGAQIRAMPVTEPDLEAAATRYADQLPPRFDVAHLGLGDDGHTASWPPGDPVLDSPLSVALSGVYRGTRRMTLTPQVINRARHRLVLVTGTPKAAAVRGWLLHNPALPIERVHRRATVLVLDLAAAAHLPVGVR
ncbi:MAG: 6-phosphogluconolactonase [Actinobacteria bacterium]|nr:6-phosphogluconolactonase [Actinomycetota bacterium]